MRCRATSYMAQSVPHLLLKLAVVIDVFSRMPLAARVFLAEHGADDPEGRVVNPHFQLPGLSATHRVSPMPCRHLGLG